MNERLDTDDLSEGARIQAKLSFAAHVAFPATYRPSVPASQFKMQGDVSVHRGSLSDVQFTIVLLKEANHPVIADFIPDVHVIFITPVSDLRLAGNTVPEN